MRKLKRCGGLTKVIEDIMNSVNAVETNDVVPGSVGVVETTDGVCLAIMTTSGRWACKTGDGLWFASKAIRSWRIQCP
jgi:hypothetical protein